MVFKKKTGIAFLIFAFIIVIAIYTTVSTSKLNNLVREGFEDITQSDTVGALIHAGKIAFDSNTTSQDKIDQLRSVDVPDDFIKHELADENKTPDQIIPLIHKRLSEIAQKYLNR